MATLYENLLGGTITDNPLTSGATTINSAAFANLPTVTGGDVLYLTLDPAGANGAPEIVQVTAHSAAATSVTVVRAQQDTSARAHPVSSTWVHALTEADIDEFLKQVVTANIVDGNVTAAKLASDSVTTAKILDANVTSAKIAADAIDGSKIADDVIDSEHYVAGSIDAEHIASDAVTTAKILDANVTTAKLAADAVTGAKIADDTIDSEHYVAGSIDAEHLASDSVTTAKILNANVTTAKIADGAVTVAKVGGDLIQVMSFANSAARDAALSGIETEGMEAYLEDVDIVTRYDGTGWVTALQLGAWYDWTPTVLQSGSVTVTNTRSKYTKIGRTIHASLNLLVTGSGTASNQIEISIPESAPASGIAVGTGTLFDTSANLLYRAVVRLISSGAIVLSPANATSIQSLGAGTFTAGLAAGDGITASFTYEAAA